MSENDVTTLQRLRRTAIRYLRHGGRSWSDVYLDDQKTSGRWAFIHINKCGGTSVERALRIPKFHHTARQRRDIVGSDRWGQMTTFTIVRHPYPRIRSLYKYRIKTGQTGMAERHIGLDDWIRAVFREQDPAYRDNPQMFLPARDWLTDETDTFIVDIIARLDQALRKSVASAKTKAALEKAALSPSVLDSPAAFQKQLAEDYVRWGKILAEAGVAMN